ncbi:hypothetical protein LSH36_734g02004 [Paralvinella palmiformis]|uniref:DUF4549 domain-containing protein n=1 Tax=Paralvinella palmiformis TaxID=53620 RepID=A0AAD9J2C3_9ANNE|nr:hypothetical protein LSH36_734g02004 [Paralvinella palmiformis]
MMEGCPYEVTSTERVINEEKQLDAELTELKAKIEENELVYGIRRPRNVSSVPLAKDADYFRKEREYVIKRGMEVCEARPVTIQADMMQKELEICLTTDYQPEGLPLLLHQFYLDHIQQLVQCKHMHMLRWARFHDHTSTIEALYPVYQERLKQIMFEYNDCLQRAQRLSAARESFMYKDNNALLILNKDDVLIYLRWLVCHLHSVKRFNQFMRVLQWLPVSHKDDIMPDTAKEKQESDELAASSRIPSKYQDEIFLTRPMSGMSTSRPCSSQSAAKFDMSAFKTPVAPHLNPTILSTNPLPASQMAYTLAASGGGIASDEAHLSLPLHTSDLNSFRSQLAYLAYVYGIEMDVENISTAAEEMELYATVNRKFRQIFNRQEQMKTFKTYDRLEIGQESWGADNSTHAVKQDSNWLPFIKMKPEKDPDLERKLVQLKAQKNMDELLRIESKFLCVSEADKVQEALREHAAAVRDPPLVTTVTLSVGHDSSSRRLRSSPQISAMWKKIYTNPELYTKDEDPLDVAMQELEDREAAEKGQRSARPSTTKKRKDSFDYMNSVQLLGLDEGEQNNNDPASIQGAFISFLQLRHLRIRDLQRTCLSILNYFHSVERTLTINDEGLSLEAGHLSKTSPQNHRKGVIDGSQGGGGGIGSHHYVHYTPKDFKMGEAEFMEFSEIENHDDFYSFEEGRVHVQDQRGYYIMYSAALDDMAALEEDLLLIASHYLEKDKELRNPTHSASRRRQQQVGDFDIPSYSHQEVDRFGVLLDLWTNEAGFLECKKELLDCYLEAYHHVFDRDEKRLLTQELTNIIYRRPRYDFSTSYFIRCYRLECMCLRLHSNLIKGILDKQIDEQREYIEKLSNHNSREFGLPYHLIQKQPISVNMSRSALKNVYLLEFHPSLAVASKLPQALRHAYWEVYHDHHPQNKTDLIMMEKNMLDIAIKEWEKMSPIGATFMSNVQKDVFSDTYTEDPIFIPQCAMELVRKVEEESKRKSQKERQMSILNAFGKVLQIYRRQAKDMSYEDFHLFLRFVQFEYAAHKERLTKPPIYITDLQEDDSMVDRVTPKTLFLAIHELDESHVGRFSFAGHEQVLQILQAGGLDNLEVALAIQVVHKNALISAIQQADVCHSNDRINIRSVREPSPNDSKSEKSTATALTVMSATSGMTSFSNKLSHGRSKPKKSPEAFMSIQLEKNPLRDKMLNEFVAKKAQMETILRNPQEMAKLKRNLLLEYCTQLQNRVGHYSLRSQIIAYYNSVLSLLEDFPLIRDNYFTLGQMNEKKSIEDTMKGLEIDSKSLKKRPRCVLTDDGQHLLNIWFIPHYTESLVMYKKLEDDKCRAALTSHLKIVASIHDILQYLCAHSRLGTSSARRGSQSRVITADWGGTEGIGTELFEIQKQINHLNDSSNPAEVSDFLVTRRDFLFLEFDAVVRHSMRDTFLSMGNLQAYRTVTDCMHHALHALSNTQRPAFNATYFNVPEPLEARDPEATLLYPYRAFINRDGPFPLHFWEWRQIEYYMRMCLAGLKEVDSHTANGEILGLSLLMEDVLTSGETERTLYAASDDDEEANEEEDAGDSRSIISNKVKTLSRPNSSTQLSVASSKKSLSRSLQPMGSFRLLKSFLCVWKRLELFKQHWGCQRLLVECIDTPALYKSFCREYRKEVLYPILQSVARRYGQGEWYEGIVSEDEPLIMPKGASEMEIRTRQLIKLAEYQECYMIKEVRKKLSKELNLVLAERQRDEDALPTDLWKKPVMKETVTINRPHIAEDFINKLMSKRQGSSDSGAVTFTLDHLNACLSKLSNDIMVRERHNYENYSMYYENVLRTHHQLLYQREQEIKQLRDQLKNAKSNNMVEVQCQLAETSHDLILEVIALRAKIEEMREDSLHQESIITEQIKAKYDRLVEDMFTCSFETLQKFDKYKVDVVADIKNMIDDVKKVTITEMDSRTESSFTSSGIFAIKVSVDLAKTFWEATDILLINDQNKSDGATMIDQVEKLRDVDMENHHMKVLLKKTRALHTWKQVTDQKRHVSELTQYVQDAERSKKECKKITDHHQEEIVLLEEQLNSLKAALKVSEMECDRIRRELEKELKIKKEKQHASQQQAQSQKQLMEARRANIDKLLEELEDKDSRLRQVTEEKDKTSKVQHMSQEKAKKNVDKMRKQLSHERNLKLNAFQVVDELRTQVYDMEVNATSRPQTAIGPVRFKYPGMLSQENFSEGRSSKSRVSSAATIKRPSTRGTVQSTGWPPAITWPANRSVTPAGDLYASVNQPPSEYKKIQRPKTTMGPLRSRITQQLLYQLEPPDHHETVIKLKEMEQLTATTY